MLDPVQLTVVVSALLVNALNLIIAIATWKKNQTETKKIQAEGDKVDAEKRKLNIEYWEGVASDLRNEMATRDKKYEGQVRRLRSAFEYLCDEVKSEYPEAVSIARKIDDGTLEYHRRPVDGDAEGKQR